MCRKKRDEDQEWSLGHGNAQNVPTVTELVHAELGFGPDLADHRAFPPVPDAAVRAWSAGRPEGVSGAGHQGMRGRNRCCREANLNTPSLYGLVGDGGRGEMEEVSVIPEPATSV